MAAVEKEHPLSVVLARLESVGPVKLRGSEYSCRCPAHQDRTPSLNFREATDRNGQPTVVMHCFAGCSTADVLAAIGLDWGDLFVSSGRGTVYRLGRSRAEQAKIDYAQTVCEIYKGRETSGAPISEQDEAYYQGALDVLDEAGEPWGTFSGLKFESAGTLVANLSPPDYLIPDLLSRGVHALLFGQWASGKSMIGIDWSCRIAGGYAIKGREVRARAVVYVCAEGQGGIPTRLAAWSKLNHLPIPENLYFLRQSIQIGDEEDIQRFAAALRQLEAEIGIPVALAVIDTLARNFGPGDENSNSDMSRHVDMLHKHVIGPGKTTVLEIHHPGHGNKERARGASALAGAVDEEFRVEKYGADWVRVDMTKAKDHMEVHGLGYQLRSTPVQAGAVTWTGAAAVEVDSLPDDHGGPDAPTLRGKASDAYNVLCALYDECRQRLSDDARDPNTASVGRQQWIAACAKAGIAADTLKKTRQRMEADGRIERVGDGYAPTNRGF